MPPKKQNQTTESTDFLELLRNKTEEADMNYYLKTSFGGYTKESVLEYLSILKRNQQTMAETFNKNQQSLLDDKERLRKTNESLQARVTKIEREYKELSEAMINLKLENTDASGQDVLALKGKLATLEEELKINKNEKLILEREIIELDNTNKELGLKLQQAQQEISAHREMLIAEKQEAKKQRELVSELTRELEAERHELRYWKGLQSQGQRAELMAKVSELTEQLSAQSEIIARQNEEVVFRKENMSALSGEVLLLKEEINNIKAANESLKLQKEKILLANSNLREKLNDVINSTIELINEKSEITIDKLLAMNRLQEAEAKISNLELKLVKTKQLEDSNQFKSV